MRERAEMEAGFDEEVPSLSGVRFVKTERSTEHRRRGARYSTANP